MAKKKAENQETISDAPEEKPAKKMLKLLIGVDYKVEDKETRVEAGLIEAGTLPPAFETLLIEKKKLIEA